MSATIEAAHPRAQPKKPSRGGIAVPYLRGQRERPAGYYDIPAAARAAVGLLYFGLAAALGVAMMLSGEQIALIRHAAATP